MQSPCASCKPEAKMVRPTTQFCCGCPLSFGVGFILLLNLMQNMFYVVTAIMNIILRIPTFGHDAGLISQTLNASWCLLGIPFILVAAWGVVYKHESQVRLYLVYMVASYILDAIFLIVSLMNTDICTTLPLFLRLHGQGFACGFMRTFTLLFTLILLSMATYFIFIVWSFCEDLKAGGGGTGFPALLAGGGIARTKRKQGEVQGYYFGSVFGGDGEAHERLNFGTCDLPGSGASRQIFQGKFHEVNYPPPERF